jgi:hypothetical protein
MMAMSIMTIGLLGMWHMHMIGISSTAAGRRHTAAMAIAEELGSGIERLAYGDALISETGPTGPTPPPIFGRLLTWGSTLVVAAGAHEWNDGTPVPGVRLDSQMQSQGQEGFQRRWSVWGYSPAAGGRSAMKLVTISVVWRDPPSPMLREVIIYTQLFDQSTFAATLGANL